MSPSPRETCCDGACLAPEREALLLGNLQVGKTALFHRLCGERAWYGPGTESSQGLQCGRLAPVLSGSHRLWHRLWRQPDDHLGPSLRLLDTPGCADLLHPQSEEEAIVQRALLAHPDAALLVVADAHRLRRGLALLLQACAFGRPMVLCVARCDPGDPSLPGLDLATLEARLGIPVVLASARADTGIAALRQALLRPRRPGCALPLPRRIREAVAALERRLAGLSVPTSAAALMLVAGAPGIEARVEAELGAAVLAEARATVAALAREVRLPLPALLADLFQREAERLASAVTRSPARETGLLLRLGDLCQHPVWGVPIAALVGTALYLWVGELGATRVVDALDAFALRGFLVPLSERLLAPLPWPLLREALLDPDFGLLPTGLFLAFGLVMPVLFFFYLAFALLSRSGYLARLSVLLDRLLRPLGLNGRGVLPLTMGFSCVTMALITTRMLERPRERLIASFLLILGLPCAPLLAVMAVILRDLPPSAWLFVAGVLLAQTWLAGWAANRLLRGRASDFIAELPPLALPDPAAVLGQTLRETWAFMREALPLFLAASLLLFAADRLGALALLERLLHPLTNGWLGLPDEAVQIFLKTLVRRETGATELLLLRERFSGLQVVITLLVMVGLTPCVNSVLVLVKEQGPWRAALIALLATAWTLVLGGLLSHACRALGVAFS